MRDGGSAVASCRRFSPGDPRRGELGRRRRQNHYVDTEDYRLFRAGFSLRYRKKAAESVDTEQMTEAVKGGEVDYQKAYEAVDKEKAAEAVDVDKVKEAMGAE